MNSLLKKLVTATAFTLIASTAAQAAVIFTVTKESDKVVTIAASGTLDGTVPNSNNHILLFSGMFDGITSTQGLFNSNSSVQGSSTIKIGSSNVNFAYSFPSNNGYAIDARNGVYIGSQYSAKAGDAVSGSLTLDLTNTNMTVANIGTTGQVQWGIFGTARQIASYTVQAKAANVPEPTSVALIGLGLAGLVARRRRK